MSQLLRLIYFHAIIFFTSFWGIAGHPGKVTMGVDDNNESD